MEIVLATILIICVLAILSYVCNEEKLKSILGFILTERVVPLFRSVSVQENLNTFLVYVEKLFA